MRNNSCEACILQVRGGNDQCYAHQLEDELTAAQAEINNLREALKPLADSLSHISTETFKKDPDSKWAPNFLAKDFIKAREAMNKASEKL